MSRRAERVSHRSGLFFDTDSLTLFYKGSRRSPDAALTISEAEFVGHNKGQVGVFGDIVIGLPDDL